MFPVSLGRKGGELASAVHAYTKTGDPYARSLVQHILSLVSHPVLSFLYRWIYDGELEDTYHEVRHGWDAGGLQVALVTVPPWHVSWQGCPTLRFRALHVLPAAPWSELQLVSGKLDLLHNNHFS